jgi:hypothetical protein
MIDRINYDDGEEVPWHQLHQEVRRKVQEPQTISAYCMLMRQELDRHQVRQNLFQE